MIELGPWQKHRAEAVQNAQTSQRVLRVLGPGGHEIADDSFLDREVTFRGNSCTVERLALELLAIASGDQKPPDGSCERELYSAMVDCGMCNGDYRITVLATSIVVGVPVGFEKIFRLYPDVNIIGE